jgi:hypothetical protein
MRVVEVEDKETRCLGVKLGHPVQVGVEAGLMAFLLKELLLRNPKKRKTDVIWQNLLRKEGRKEDNFANDVV